MDAKLVVVGGKASKRQVSLKLPSVIGRSRDADLTVAHPMVSRQHCELFDVNGVLRIRDLGSLNGTFVGNERVQEAELYPSDEFTVGPLTFRVKYRYVGEIASAPKVTPPTDKGRPPELEVNEAAPDVAPVDAEPGADALASPPAGTEPEAVEAPPAIAPVDGELPDFGAWDAMSSPPGEAEHREPSPPPPLFDQQAPPERETELEIRQPEQGLPPLAPDDRPPIEVVPIDEAEAENGPGTAKWEDMRAQGPGPAEPPGSEDAPHDAPGPT